MVRFLSATALALTITRAVIAQGQVSIVPDLTESVIASAISLGQKYKNAEKLWNQEFEKTNEIKMSGFWAWSGSKRLHIFTDHALISLAAAEASHQRRPFSASDAKELPDLGSVRVVVVISGGDYFLRSDKEGTFGSGRAHMILKLKGELIQPTRKAQVGLDFAPESQEPSMTQLVRTVMISATESGSREKDQIVYQFIFSLPQDLGSSLSEFVLIGNDDVEHAVKVDLSKLR